MSRLRRTALARRTALRPGGSLRRTPSTARAAQVKKTVTRQQQATVDAAARRRVDTGPTAVQRRAVAERAGYRCELCPQLLGYPAGARIVWTAAHSFHHRRPRAMGGTSRVEANEPPNLLLLCGSGVTGCHGRAETNRQLALALGWLVPQALDPAQVPVSVARRDGHGWSTVPVLLTPDGRYEELT